MPRDAAVRLREAGYGAVGVRDTLRAGASDEEVFAEAQGEDRAIITRDTDFSELARSLNAHTGVVLLRLGDMRSSQIIDRLLAVCSELNLSSIDLTDAIVVVERTRVRTRKSERGE
jgi:predicted nuclease of predicted toxin-antitoxin system